jgi:hypothetical protein
MKPASAKNAPQKKADFAFGRENYILTIAAVALVAIGFILMSGGGSEDPNVFNEKELFSTRRITVAPIVVLIGYAVGLYAILRKPAE